MDIELIEREWKEVQAKARQEWLAVLNDPALCVPEERIREAGFFDSRACRFIQAKVKRWLDGPRLPNGGYEELKMARRLEEIGRARKDYFMISVAAAYRKTRGWYYTCKIASDHRAALTSLLGKEYAKASPDKDLLWALELCAKGTPTLVGNFRMHCYYVLEKEDGTRDKVVEVITEKGEGTGQRKLLDAESAVSPVHLREWLHNNTNAAVWMGGEKELELLALDMAEEAAFNSVREIVAAGYDAASGIWFFGDCAFTPEGRTLLPDAEGVYWHKEFGFALGRTGSHKQEFRQPLPMFHPHEILTARELSEETRQKCADLPWADYALEQAELDVDDTPAVRMLFAELCDRFKSALGGEEAWFVMGAIIAFLGRPEVFRRERGFPGLLVTGETRQGKSTTIQWGMELWGVHNLAEGVGLLKSSAVGIQILGEQCSCVPAWVSVSPYPETGETISRAWRVLTCGLSPLAFTARMLPAVEPKKEPCKK